MLSVTCLPLPQEEEGSQEEQEALYRRHAEVLWLSRLPAGRDPSLKPLSCMHHLLFRCKPFQGSHYFEINQLPILDCSEHAGTFPADIPCKFFTLKGL
jgi:hypothetical protein